MDSRASVHTGKQKEQLTLWASVWSDYLAASVAEV